MENACVVTVHDFLHKNYNFMRSDISHRLNMSITCTYTHTQRVHALCLWTTDLQDQKVQEQWIWLPDPKDEGTTVLQNFASTHPPPVTPSHILGDGHPTAKAIKSTEAQKYHIPHQPWRLHSWKLPQLDKPWLMYNGAQKDYTTVLTLTKACAACSFTKHRSKTQ
jgi:hypothetical protein